LKQKVQKKESKEVTNSKDDFSQKKIKKYVKKKQRIETQHDTNMKEMNDLFPMLRNYLNSMTEPNYPAKFECTVKVRFFLLKKGIFNCIVVLEWFNLYSSGLLLFL
jgi:ATP-dependent Lon protease